MKQILLKTPRGNTAVIPVDHFVSKANAPVLSGEAFLFSSKEQHFVETRHNCGCFTPAIHTNLEAHEDAIAIAAAIDTTHIFEHDDVDKRGKAELLYELIGASKRRDVGRKRNVRTLYNLQVEGEDDRMDIDNDEFESQPKSCEDDYSVATQFDGIDINSDDHCQNFRKSRRRSAVNSGVRSSSIPNGSTTPQLPRSLPFQQTMEGRKPISQSGCPVSPSSSNPPFMVAFYHEGRKVSLDRIWDWITGSSAKSANEANISNSKTPLFPLYLTLSTSVRLLGGIDRQNRVGSKFGGGGVSSSQNAERERKERLKQLALESIDLAKDPYLMRNHLGTYECKLCLTLHTNEANYLAHTQGKKHQAGLAKRAHMEKLRKEREEQQNERNNLKRPPQGGRYDQQSRKTIKIGRPAYQVFKSRDTNTQQRCLTFELTYKDIKEDLRPRHRFMSAFEQRVDLPRDKRYQYILFAAEPYETIAFKIPNEALDRDPGRLITHWDEDDKKFTLTLYFEDNAKADEDKNTPMETDGSGAMHTFAPALSS